MNMLKKNIQLKQFIDRSSQSHAGERSTSTTVAQQQLAASPGCDPDSDILDSCSDSCSMSIRAQPNRDVPPSWQSSVTEPNDGRTIPTSMDSVNDPNNNWSYHTPTNGSPMVNDFDEPDQSPRKLRKTTVKNRTTVEEYNRTRRTTTIVETTTVTPTLRTTPAVSNEPNTGEFAQRNISNIHAIIHKCACCPQSSAIIGQQTLQFASSVQAQMNQNRSEFGRQLLGEYQQSVIDIVSTNRIAENQLNNSMTEITNRIRKLEAALLAERQKYHECVLQADIS